MVVLCSTSVDKLSDSQNTQRNSQLYKDNLKGQILCRLTVGAILAAWSGREWWSAHMGYATIIWLY